MQELFSWIRKCQWQFNIVFKCLSCNKNYSNKIDKNFKKWFRSTFKFSNNDIDKFVLLMREGVYPYEWMGKF